MAVSPDTDLDNPADVYAITTGDPARDIVLVPDTRGSLYDRRPHLSKAAIHFVVGKMGIDATIKTRHDKADFERAWPRTGVKCFSKTTFNFEEKGGILMYNR